MRATDARGFTLEFERAPRRIVSLVPSLTETLFALERGGSVVGVTDYCVHPARGVHALPRVGGTKNPRVSDVVHLAPDLVLANKEENRQRDVERLEAAGLRVLVTYARTVDQAVAEIRELGGLLEREREAEAIAKRIEAALSAAVAARPARPTRVEALIWKDPYMVVGGDTFAHDLLVQCGGRSAFADDTRRYPRVDEATLAAARPEVILLPTEPYAFGESERVDLLRLDCPAARSGRIHVVEGELLSWYGPRIARALALFSGLLRDAS